MYAQMIGAALQLGGAIGGGIASRRNQRRMEQRANAQLAKQEARAERAYYQDATQSAEAQYAISQMKDYLRQQRQAAAGASAIGGGTEETLAAQKAADNASIAQTYGQVAASGAAQKQSAMNALNDISNQRISAIKEAAAARNQNIQNAMNSINSAGQGISSGFVSKENSNGK